MLGKIGVGRERFEFEIELPFPCPAGSLLEILQQFDTALGFEANSLLSSDQALRFGEGCRDARPVRLQPDEILGRELEVRPVEGRPIQMLARSLGLGATQRLHVRFEALTLRKDLAEASLFLSQLRSAPAQYGFE